MEESFGSRLKSAWNAFFNRDPTEDFSNPGGMVYTYRPDRVRFTGGNERSIVNSIYNRISIDAASIEIKHAMLDQNGRYVQSIDSSLNNCFNLEANKDQTGRAFFLDIYQSLLDEGVVAIVPTDTINNPRTGFYKILELRTGKILEWRPNTVRIRVYNESTGKKEDIVLPKSVVGIVENPFYSVMNERNSTLQRLIHKLNILDAIDEQSGSGKLDLIIQLPYVVKTESRKKQAEARRKELEDQLTGTKYGIAYADGTERITQLNRPIENNLMKQIEYLTNMLYSQLGITQSIMDGTADDKTMLNYYNRTIEPIVSAVVDEMKRKFLTKTARTRGQSIVSFRDPFKLVPVNELATISDALTRNEILTSNEIRQLMGFKPSGDPKADELRNSNINQANDNYYEQEYEEEVDQPYDY